MRISIPANASLEDVKIGINYELSSDRKYSFRVYRTIKVGLADVGMWVFDRKMKDGRLEIEQIITNHITSETTLNFRCNLFVPNQQRQRRVVTKLQKGIDRRFYYLPNAEALRGKTLWLRAEEINGNRVLNFRWKVLGPQTHKKNKPPKSKQDKPVDPTKKKVPSDTPNAADLSELRRTTRVPTKRRAQPK
jgi:hypothetical protein